MSTLTLEQANQIIAAALSDARQAGYNPMAVAVLDEGGSLKAFAREDGASMFRIDIGTAKAWSAIAIGASTKQLARRAKENPNFFVSLASTACMTMLGK